MAAAVDIRPAERGDADSLQRMIAALVRDIGAPPTHGSAEDLRRYGFGEDPCFSAWIASVAGAEAGMVLGFAEYSTWRGRPGFYVQDLYVEPAHRRSGVARALLARAARECGRSGGTYLRLSAAASNRAAADFYLRLGFREKSDERPFVLEGDPFDGLIG